MGADPSRQHLLPLGLGALVFLGLIVLALLGTRPGQEGLAELGPAASEPPLPAPPVGKPDPSEPARRAMVQDQIASSMLDGRIPVKDPRVLEAMRRVRRHAFVPAQVREHAYDDSPLPIGYGQTISQPYIVGLMTELLELKPGQRVLEIGTGSGYQAAVLAEITSHVHTIEIVKPLAARVRQTLDAEGYHHVRSRQGDGYDGWPEAGPFDAIIVTCSAGHLPPPLWQQLKPGGRIVVPIGAAFAIQRLVVIEKTPQGKRRSRTVLEVRFVPMTGKLEEGPR